MSHQVRHVLELVLGTAEIKTALLHVNAVYRHQLLLDSLY